MSLGARPLKAAGGVHGLAVAAVLLAITVALAVLLHWSVASIGALTLLGVVLRRALSQLADAREARAERAYVDVPIDADSYGP